MSFRPGELSAPDAARLNEMYRELERWKRLSVAAPLSLNRGAGSVCISLSQAEDAAAAVSAWKAPVRAATTTAGTLASSFENGDTIDGVTLATGDRILIKDQSTASENGIYTVNASGAPTRATDADTGTELLGATVVVTEGTLLADTVWLCTANATITVGSTALPWTQVGAIPFVVDGSASNTQLTTDSTWTDTDYSITVGAGTYLLYGMVSATGTASVAGSSTWVEVRIWNSTTSAEVNGDATFLVLHVQTAGFSNVRGSRAFMIVAQFTGSNVLLLQAQRGSGSWSGDPQIDGGSGYANAFGALKLS